MKVKLITALISAALLSMNAYAQTTKGTTTGGTTVSTATTTVPEDQLIKKYTPLAGSEANATKLVTGLRDGSKEITLTSGSGSTSTTTTIVNPTAGKTMGYGNVNIVLAMADRMLSGMTNPTSSDLSKVLTNPDNGILTLRTSGMGWGQIANTLGFKVGDVMKAAAAQDAADKKAGLANQQSAKGQSKAGEGRPESKSVERSGAPEKIERPQKVERPEKIERPQRVERPEMPQRPERGGR